MPEEISALYFSYNKAWFRTLDVFEELTNVRFHRFVQNSREFSPIEAESYTSEGNVFPPVEDYPMPEPQAAHLVEYLYLANRMACWKSLPLGNSISGDSFYEQANKYKYYLWRFAGFLKRQKIRFVLMHELPSAGLEYVMWRAAQLTHTPVVGLCTFMSFDSFFALDDLDRFSSLHELPDINDDVHFPIATEPVTWWYMKHRTVQSAARRSRLREGLAPVLRRKYRRFLRDYVGRRAINDNPKAIRRAKAAFRRQYATAVSRIEDLPGQIAYFPLQMQYEVTSTPLGAQYADQLDAVGKLRELVPPDITIAVKENPKQQHFMRDELFFRRLKAIPNTRYLGKKVSSDELIDRSILVASLNGTAGWEAICRGKPALVFGRSWYECFPGVFHYRAAPRPTFQEIAAWQFSAEKLQQQYEMVRRKLLKGIVGATERTFLTRQEAEQNDRLLVQQLCHFLRVHFKFTNLRLRSPIDHDADAERAPVADRVA